MIKEAIILAGGYGTRLRETLPDIPKPMAEIMGKPFLTYLMDYLIDHEVEKVVLSVGYKSDVISSYFGNQYQSITIDYAVEEEPLGTGGGIKKAMDHISSDGVYVLNGDTYFEIDLDVLYTCYKKTGLTLVIALKPMNNFERYGTVEIDDDNRIIGFREKQFKEFGLINGGIYLINKNLFSEVQLPDTFSFEKDLMEKYYSKHKFYAVPFDDYFIDVGIPEDYSKAQKEFERFSG